MNLYNTFYMYFIDPNGKILNALAFSISQIKALNPK